MLSEPEQLCPQCQMPLRSFPARPYPVVLQALFGVSFLAFLLVFDKIHAHREWIWVWSVVQIALGAALVRRRLQARKRVLRCIRCSPALR